MNLGLFSVSTFDLIPLCKRITDYFSEAEHKYQIEIVECRFNNSVAYHPDIRLVNLGMVHARKEFHTQTMGFRIKKYALLIFHITSFFFRSRSAVAYTMDLSTLNILLFFKSLFFYKRIFVIYHQFEMVEFGRLSKFKQVNFRLFKLMNKRLDLFIVPERNRLEYFCRYAGLDEKHTMIFANTTSVANSESTELINGSEELTIAHVGIAGMDHYVGEFMELIKKLGNQRKIRVLFIGYLPDEVNALISSYNLPFVQTLGDLPHSQLMSLYQEIDIGVILYKDLGFNFRYCAPNKLYEYWSNGIFVIANELDGLKSVFADENMGVLCNMDETEQFEEKLIFAIEGSSASRKEKALAKFESDYAIGTYLSNLEQLLIKKGFGCVS